MVMNMTLDKIKRHVQVVVAESMVLLRIKDFQQRGRRVASEIRPDLVDFVEHEYGIVRSRQFLRP